MKNISKTALFLGISLSLSGCLDDSPFAVKGENGKAEIEISGQIEQRSMTRVTDAGFADGDAIGVYIVDYVKGEPGTLLAQGNHATNVKFTYDEGAGKWTGAAKIYWTDSKTAIDGYSYYPFREVIANPQEVSFSVSTRQDSQEEGESIGNYEASDFLWAKAAQVSPGQVIDLRHHHLMAGVEINLIPGTGFDAKTWAGVEKIVQIDKVITDASINLGTGAVTAMPAEQLQTVVPYDKGDGTFRAVLVPQTKAGGETLFHITVDGASYQFKRESEMTFTSQKLHKFTIEVIQRLPEGDYEFKLIDEAVTAWDDDGISHNGEAREYVVMQSPVKGQLRQVLESSGKDLEQLLNLKIVGEMNPQDFTALRELVPNLEAINLQEVQLKEGNYNEHDENPEDGVLPSKAFYCCTTLKYVVFPKNLKKIGDYAFRGAGLSGALDIPEGVTHIGLSAFDNSDSNEGAHMYLTSLSLPTTLEYIGESSFCNNKFNCELILPEHVKEIGVGAFQGCMYLYGQLNLPSGLEVLGNRAFAGLPKLTGPLVIPAGIKEVSGLEGIGCSSLVLPEGLEKIGDFAFGSSGTIYPNNFQGELYVPQTVRSIGVEAFCGTQFSYAYLPEGLTELSEGIFSGCDKLIDTLKVPTTVKQIRRAAFNGCSSLTAIILPEGLESIGGYDEWGQSTVFDGCYSLDLLRCDAKVPPVLIGDVFGSLPKDNFTVQVPAESVEAYRNAEGWKEFKRIAAYSDFVCRPQFANLLNKGHEREVVLNADGAWTVKSIPSWCSISANSGYKKTALTITINDLADGQGTRQDSIVFSLDGTEHTTCYYIKQYDSDYKEDEEYALQTASRGNGIDLVILGDGYDAEDIADGTYLNDMQQTAEYFFGMEPFKTYRDYFNVKTAWALSNESGIGTLNTLRDTKFDTQYGNYTADSRISCNSDYTMQYVVENTSLTEQDLGETLVILVPNSTTYDGLTYMWSNGAALSICPKSTFDFPNDARGLVQHEACGHGFTKLADEYMYHKAWIQTCICSCCKHVDGLLSMQAIGQGQNLSFSGNYQEVPWAHLIEDARYNDIVDIYDGGYFHSNGVYRSESNSVMNNNVPYMSTWCRELAVRRIKQLADEPFDYEDFVANDNREWGLDFTTDTRASREMPAMDAMHGAHPVIINRSPNLHTK